MASLSRDTEIPAFPFLHFSVFHFIPRHRDMVLGQPWAVVGN